MSQKVGVPEMINRRFWGPQQRMGGIEQCSAWAAAYARAGHQRFRRR